MMSIKKAGWSDRVGLSKDENCILLPHPYRV